MKKSVKLLAILLMCLATFVTLISCGTCQHRDIDDNSLCDKCGESYTDGKDVEDEHTHIFARQSTEAKYLKSAADCENAAKYYYSCSCGEIGVETYESGSPLGHDEVNHEAKAPTCTEIGYDAYVACTRCDYSTREDKSALGHSYANGVCTVCNAKLYKRDGNTIYFGSYPQSEVTDSALKETLLNKAGTLPTSTNAQKWTSYGYYKGGGVSNYMWYIDVVDGEEKYRGVYFTSYRPYWPSYSDSSDNSIQDDHGYVTGTVHWFKWEQISWTVLTEEDGKALLLCNIIIDSQAYDYKGGSNYYNDYADSTIRRWLNETFYNTAFTELQREIIETTTVDNSVYSTGDDSNRYACEDTNDKIFLPSYREVTNSSYGFATGSSTCDTARRRKTSDYAQSQGAYIYSGGLRDGNGYWWLRSPSYSHSSYAYDVCGDGIFGSDRVYNTISGVVPALWIRL